MAGSRKTSNDEAQNDPDQGSDERIEDAVVIEEDGATKRETAAEEEPAEAAEPGAEDAREAEADGEPAADTAGKEDAEAAAVQEEVQAGEGAAEPDEPEVAEQTSETTETPGPPPAPQRPAGPGAFPLIIGGIIAAVIGFAASRVIFPDGWPGQGRDMSAAVAGLDSRIAEQDARLAAIEESAATLRSAIEGIETVSSEDLSAVESATTEQVDALRQQIARLETELGVIASELGTLSRMPMPEGFDPAAFDAEMEEFRSELTSAVEEARAQVAEAQARAEEIAAAAAEEAAALQAAAAAEAAAREAEARAAAEAALRQAALSQIEAAIDNGQPYADVIPELEGVDVPAALMAGADNGVAALAELQEGFPDAARAALDASIRASVDGSALDRAVAFLRVQTGARSLEPRDGTDPDAVLARAEAALRTGDLAGALSELEGLPEAGAAQMSGWIGLARARQDAIEALERLSDAETTN